MGLVCRSHGTLGRFQKRLQNDGQQLHGVCDVGILSALEQVTHLRRQACITLLMEARNSDIELRSGDG